MKKFKLSNIDLILLGSSIIVFGVVVGLGAIIKKIELTIILLSLPILLGIASDITAVMSLVKKDRNKLQSILLIVFITFITAFMILFMLMLRGLWKFT